MKVISRYVLIFLWPWWLSDLLSISDISATMSGDGRFPSGSSSSTASPSRSEGNRPHGVKRKLSSPAPSGGGSSSDPLEFGQVSFYFFFLHFTADSLSLGVPFWFGQGGGPPNPHPASGPRDRRGVSGSAAPPAGVNCDRGHLLGGPEVAFSGRAPPAGMQLSGGLMISVFSG